MRKKVLVPATRLELGASPEPMPWQRQLSSLAYEVSHVVLYQGLHRSWRCSSILPVVGSRTDRANGLSLCKRALQRAEKLVVPAVLM